MQPKKSPRVGVMETLVREIEDLAGSAEEDAALAIRAALESASIGQSDPLQAEADANRAAELLSSARRACWDGFRRQSTLLKLDSGPGPWARASRESLERAGVALASARSLVEMVADIPELEPPSETIAAEQRQQNLLEAMAACGRRKR